MSLDDIFNEVPAKKDETKKEEKKDEKKLEQPTSEVAKVETPVVKQSLDDIFASDANSVEALPANAVEGEETGPEEKLSDKPPEIKPLPRNITFDEETEPLGKTIYVIYGDKGNGKTTLAFSFPGEKACLSYDRKAMPIKTDMYNNDKAIHVFNAIGLMGYGDPKEFAFTSEETFNYSCALLDDLKNKSYDWVIIDGTEILSRICEAAMRYRNNIQPFAGIKNRNLWKERRLYINQIHVKAMAAAKKGIIYTTFTDIEEIIDEGETTTKKKVPAWIDVILTESDIVIYTEMKMERGITKYYANVNSSKRKYIKSGSIVDITGTKGYDALLEAAKR